MLSFKASAPGSLMLLGEHAVLHGHAGVVCAIDKRMTVQLVPRPDKQIEIHSSLGHYQTDITQIEIVAPFKFVLATLKKFQKQLKRGCTITVESEFSDQVGLASSAAVTVATLSALSTWLGHRYPATQLIRHARSIVQTVQGRGSGADVAACVLGGVIAYRMQPLLIKRIADALPLTVVYSGNKTPTTEVLARVNNVFSAYPTLFKRIMQSIGDCAQQGIVAATNNNWIEFGKMMDIQQGLMDALGVNTPLLSGLILELRSFPAISGAKISGSGLGDCVIGLGALENFTSKYPVAKQVLANITTEGVRCEKI